ncbi:MAG: hypothetical protein K1X81_02605 [Bacteroidia bacterium]|nr:hypothetical protein [Bacteroidia bacterium]
MRTLLLLLIATAFISCGPSKAEIEARERQVADSTKMATEAAIKADAEAKAREQKRKKDHSQLKQQLIEMKARLAAEEAKLQDINSFHLMRTSTEKQQQLAAQTYEVEMLKAAIEETEAKLKQLQ